MGRQLLSLAIIMASILGTKVLMAQPPDTIWTRTYGDSGVSAAYGVAELPGGGFIVGGYTPEEGDLQSDVWLFRVDVDGNMVWEDKIGYPDTPEQAYTLEPALDGEFVLAGLGVSEEGRGKAYIIKADSNGGGWGFYYGWITENTYAYHAVATTYHGVVAVGYQTLDLAGANVYVVATGPSGLFAWERVYNWGWADKARGVTRTRDGGYMVTGETNSFGLHTYGIFLQKLDSLGLDDGFVLITWEGDQYANCVQQTLDGGYIIAGYEKDPDHVDLNMLIIKTDSYGMMEWHKIYGGDSHDVATYVYTLPGGGYIVTGVGRKPGALHNDVWVLRLDANGDTLWTKFIGAELIGTEWINESSYQIRPTSDGGYIIAGARGVGYMNTRAYLIRLAPDPEGIVDNRNNHIAEKFVLYPNYPNPFNSATTIRYQVQATTEVTLRIYDLLAREVATLVNERKPAGTYTVCWDGTGDGGQPLASGIYFYRLKVRGDFVQTHKMLLLR